MKAVAAALALAALAAVPAFAQGGAPAWRELETLRQDRFQLGQAYHIRTRDHRWLAHELAVGNRAAAADIGQRLAGDDRLIAQARARLQQDERAAPPASPF